MDTSGLYLPNAARSVRDISDTSKNIIPNSMPASAVQWLSCLANVSVNTDSILSRVGGFVSVGKKPHGGPSVGWDAKS